MGVDACADLLRVSDRTIRNWEAGAVRIPYAAYKLLRVLRGGRYLGHPVWRDYRVWGDTLYTPEGHHFQAGEAVSGGAGASAVLAPAPLNGVSNPPKRAGRAQPALGLSLSPSKRNNSVSATGPCPPISQDGDTVPGADDALCGLCPGAVIPVCQAPQPPSGHPHPSHAAGGAL